MQAVIAVILLIGFVAYRMHVTGALQDPKSLRILVKSVTWRVIGTTQVILLARYLSGSWDKAFAIGVPDTVVKLTLGIMHERLWETEFGRNLEYKRAWKTATWKVFAITSTIVIATMYGNYDFAIKLGPIDTVFKSINYYAHELLWDRVTWGVAAPPKQTSTAKSN